MTQLSYFTRVARPRLSAFDWGLNIGEAGGSRDENPYERDSAAFDDWNAGFETGKECAEASRWHDE